MSFRRRYLARLDHDLTRWAAAGLVAPERRDALLADAGAHLAAEEDRPRAAAVMALLGVLLLGAGAIAFVAANWDAMARSARLAVLFAAMTAAFAGGWWFAGPGRRPQVGQGLFVLGVLLFGADVMLVAQTYHIQAHYPNGVLLWAAGAVLAAAVIPAPWCLWVAFPLIGLWSGQELVAFERLLHGEFLLAWAVAAGLAALRGWWGALRLGLVVLAGWYALSGIRVAAETELTGSGAAALFMIVPLALWAAGEAVPRVGGVLHGLGLLGAMAAAFLVAFPEIDPPSPPVALLAGGGGLAAVAVGAAMARWRGRLQGAAVAVAAAVALLAPLRLGLAMAMGEEMAALVLMLVFLAVVVALALAGGRHADPFTRRVAYVAFAADIVLLYMTGVVSLLALFVVFTVAGAALVASALRLERRT